MTSGPPFLPVLSILPPAQRRLWTELGDIPEGFVLYGGTALAPRLAHRQSVDFDFFHFSRFLPGDLIASMPMLAGATITQQAADTLTVVVDRDGPVKLSFFGVPGIGRLNRPDDGNLWRLPKATKHRLVAASRQVDPGRLPSLTRLASNPTGCGS